MAIHLKMPAEEAADRLAIRELFDAYAHCADRRDAQGQMALFTPDTRFLACMDSHSEQPTQELHGRESLAPVFENLNTYQVTTHFNGQSTVVLDGDRATGESYCIAHHLYEADGQRTLMIASIRYLDQFARQSDGSWLFAERKLMVDWTETRPSDPDHPSTQCRLVLDRTSSAQSLPGSGSFRSGATAQVLDVSGTGVTRMTCERKAEPRGCGNHVVPTAWLWQPRRYCSQAALPLDPTRRTGNGQREVRTER